MPRLSVTRVASAVLVAAMLVVTCSDPRTVAPTGPSPLAIASVQIEGPDTLAPGQSAPYTVIVTLADGTRKAATAETRVTWRSSNAAVQVDASGHATARWAGDATLTVILPSARGASREVVVVPEGTYRLTGVVSDAEFPELRISGAAVEVVPDGPATTTDGNGLYRLYGVPPDAELRVTAPGYEPAAQSIHLTGHASRHVPLTLSGSRLGLSGAYTLKIDNTGTCTALDASLQHREYAAVVTQTGFKLNVVLTGAEFRTKGAGNRFSGVVTATGATFQLDPLFYYYYYFYYDFSYPSLAEVLTDDLVLVIHGVAATTGSKDGLSGTLKGDLTVWSFATPAVRYVAGCSSQALDFRLVPR